MTSKFDKLLQDTKEPKAERTPRKKAKPKPKAEASGSQAIETETQEITITRAVGKRSKDDYTQVSAYIPKNTHKRVKAALVDDGRDFSELVTDLLADWLKGRG